MKKVTNVLSEDIIKLINSCVTYYEHHNNWYPVEESLNTTEHAIKIDDIILKFVVVYGNNLYPKSGRKVGNLPVRHLSIDKSNKDITDDEFSKLVITYKDAFHFTPEAIVFESSKNIIHVMEELFQLD